MGALAHRLTRLRLAGLLVAAACTACGSQVAGPAPAATSSATSPGVDLTGTVAWVDPTPGPFVVPVPAPRPTAPPCLAQDLRVAGDRVGAASGTFDNIAVRNTGRSTCTLSGYPSVTGLDASHHRIAVPTKRDTMADDARTEQRPATIDPDGIAHVILASSSSCDPGTYRLIVTRVGLGVGGAELSTDVSLWGTCRVGVGPWNVDVPPVPSRPGSPTV